jgi:ATP-dependent exoDNAse (exonuclease V) alpha subunit
MSENSNIECKVKVNNILYPRGRGDVSGEWGIISCSPIEVISGEPFLDKYDSFILKGILPFIDMCDTYKVIAKLIKDEKYGWQYEIVYINSNVDLTDKDEQRIFLSKILTPSQMGELYKVLDNPFEIIKSENIEQLTGIKGIGIKTANRIIQRYKENIDYSKILVELDGYGFTQNMLSKLIETYKSPDIIIEKIKNNPYILADDMEGIGWNKADAIAIKSGIDVNSDFRIKAFIKHYLNNEAENGHSYVNPSDLLYAVEEMLGEDANQEQLRNILHELYEKGNIHWDEEKTYICLKGYYELENNITNELYRLLRSKNDFKYSNYELVLKTLEQRQGWEYTDEQREAIKMALDNNVCIITGGAGTGKAQPLDSDILTENGYVKNRDIKIKDKIFGDDGELYSVVGVYPQGIKDVYEIVFSDRTTTRCCKEHLWNYQTKRQRDEYKPYDTDTLENIIKIPLYTVQKDMSKKWNIYIPIAKPLNFTNKELPIDPYIFGLLLGDGSFRKKVVFFNTEEDIIQIFKKYCIENNFNLVEELNYKGSYRIVDLCRIKSGRTYLNRMTSIIRELELYNKKSENKFIPDIYKYNSIQNRIELLGGLIDTDGEISGSSYVFSSTSRQLIDDVVFLVQSLGGTATTSNRQTKFTYNNIKKDGLPSYRLHIKLPFNISICKSLKHKDKIKKGQTSPRRSIREIRYIGKEECQCIMTSNPSQLYLTDNCIVTHNTSAVEAITTVLKDYTFGQTALAGKAAARLTEATGQEGCTIHRLLGYNPRTGFTFNKNRPMFYDIILLDETSMVGGDLFYKLIQAIASGSKLIMLGDTGQLESIGLLNVFKDMIESKVIPMIELTEIHRQAQKSAIITNSVKIRHSEQITKQGWTGIETRGELQDLTVDIFDDKILTAKKVIEHFKTEYATHKNIMDIQIIVPVKEKGDACTLELNNEIQEYYNPQNQRKREVRITNFKKTYTLREGDKVINVKNNYKTFSVDGREQSIFNGYIGIISEIDRYCIIVDFDLCGKVVIPKKSWNSLEMAYAITCHKFQGSQSNIIIVGLDYNSYSLLTKEWVYTAITRASKKCILCAEESALRYAISNSNISAKQTFLCEMLKNYYVNIDF